MFSSRGPAISGNSMSASRSLTRTRRTVHDGFEHAGVVERPSPLIDELFDWTRDRFAGLPVAEGCTTTER